MTERRESLQRRRYLTLIGVVGVGGLAGCLDGDDEQADDTDPDGDDSEPEETTDETDDESADDDDTQETDDGEAEEDETEDDDEIDDEDDGENDEDEEVDGPRLRDVFNWESSYVVEFEFGQGTGTQIIHDGNSHLQGEFNGEEIETYRIETDDGVETYTVMDGQCYAISTEIPDGEIFDPEEPEADDEEYFSTGTTTVEGQEVYIFDVEDGILYISVSTGYPVRFEGEEGSFITFHSWGETDPITPPDMECIEP